MMKKIVNKLILGSLTLLLVSCVDLDEKPKDFLGPTNFYNSPDQIKSAFNATMAKLYRPWGVYGYSFRGFFTNDDLYEDWGSAQLLFNSGTGNGFWRTHYAAITDINLTITAMKAGNLNQESTEEEINKLMGEARFLRAYNYFTLVRLYGAVPIIDENLNPVTDQITRNPIADVYNFIVEDLQFASANLPETTGYSGSPTSGTAKGLLAKVYMTMASEPLKDESKWALARDAAADVIDDGIHSLEPDVEKVFALDNFNGPEIMFAFQANIDRPTTPPQVMLPSYMTGWSDFRVEPQWFEDYPEQDRKDAYLLTEAWDGTKYDEWDTSRRYIRKFVYDTEDNARRRVSTQGTPILRYADVLLIYAEAANMANGGPTQEAVDALNAVINRANGGVANANYPLVTMGMSKDAFDTRVLQERELELCFEFDRWFDLIRKGILCEEIQDSYKPNCSKEDYLLPIPGPDLSETITQNPGY